MVRHAALHYEGNHARVLGVRLGLTTETPRSREVSVFSVSLWLIVTPLPVPNHLHSEGVNKSRNQANRYHRDTESTEREPFIWLFSVISVPQWLFVTFPLRIKSLRVNDSDEGNVTTPAP